MLNEPKNRSLLEKLKQWLKRNKRLAIGSLLVVLGLFIIVQLLYPRDRMPLFAKVDGVSVGGWQKAAAIKELDKRMASQDIAIYLGDADKSYAIERPKTIGLTVSNSERINNISYPWYMRMIPTSLLWYGFTVDQPAAQVALNEDKATSFINKSLGKSCSIPPVNASLTYKDSELEVVPAKNGGKCEEAKALKAFASVEPHYDEQITVNIPVTNIKPKVQDKAASELKQKLEQATKDGVKISVDGATQTINQADLLSWLAFSSDNNRLTYSLSSKKAADFIGNISKKVSKPAGTTYITTRDFTVISEKKGATGRALAVDATLSDIKSVMEGTKPRAEAFIAPVEPKVDYKRTYTKTSTGLAALIQHYAEDNPGTFGVSFAELGGENRSAQYDSSKVFTTASTYKLFIAYGTFKKIEDKKWKWSDEISGGRDLSQCFDDMIVKSDNACAEALLKKLGFRDLTNQIQSLGLYNSSFLIGDMPQTSAGDLALFLTKLQQDQLPITSSNRDRLLSAMKRNIHRQGIPAGASGQVADKVGFLNGLLHDAAIVYSPKGTYVLVIMTDGSTWANIADLTKEIESLR